MHQCSDSASGYIDAMLVRSSPVLVCNRRHSERVTISAESEWPGLTDCKGLARARNEQRRRLCDPLNQHAGMQTTCLATLLVLSLLPVQAPAPAQQGPPKLDARLYQGAR